MKLTPEIYYLLLGGFVIFSVFVILFILSYIDKHKRSSKEV